MKKVLYLLEVGVLLPKKHKEYNDYSQVYDKKHSYYDENVIFFTDYSKAIEYALTYIVKGVKNTYAIIKQVFIDEDVLTDYDYKCIETSGIFDEWAECFSGERLRTDNIMLDIYKSTKNTLKYRFIEYV